MLEHWPPIPPREALELLDSKFGDPRIRAFAVKCLQQLSDNDLEGAYYNFTFSSFNENYALWSHQKNARK
jgi:hypothetical protein